MDDERTALDELTTRLWDERRIVTLLLYKLTVSRLLLAADERRFVPEALREVDQTVEVLREGEIRRESALRELAGLWQVMPDELSLPELVRRSPAPFDHLFHDHLTAFTDLAIEIEAVTRENRTLARSELVHLTGAIDLLTGVDRPAAATYDATGRLDANGAVGGRLREAL